jgi:parvulin-like peptidyl-prolyl isomerase
VRLKLSTAGLFGASCIAGILCAQLICSSVFCRTAIGLLFARGKLLALAHGSGIYQADVLRVVRELQDVTTVDKFRPPEVERSILSRLVANVGVEDGARQERISPATIDREYDLLRLQIRPQMAWIVALHANGLSAWSLRRRVAEGLRGRQWIERETADRVRVTPDECLRYYEAHLETYAQPIRFRASHLFLAAPPETSPEVVEAKRSAVEAFSARIVDGESFAELVALASEDEATKMRGGDLGFFSESRMPPDFFAAIRNMRVGEISRVVRTRLGFHIIQLTDAKAPHQMTFDQSRMEISLMFGNEKRATALEELTANLSPQAEFIRVPLQ